jgi:hypothetical protein
MAGCSSDDSQVVISPDSHHSAPAASGSAIDLNDTATVQGRVIWDGPVPAVPPFLVFAPPDNPPPDGKRLTREANPFRPQVDPDNHGLKDAVVFLRGIDPEHVCAWPHPPVRIEHRHRLLCLVQGDQSSRVGFVRRGDAIEVVNHDREYHALRGRGAAFFNLPLVEAEQSSSRRLDQGGVVHLSSGAGYFWMQAHLIVVEHPYYARTDRDGRFRMEHVPAGRYEAVCWMPSWRVARKDRDPESSLIWRVTFYRPVEQTAPVVVERHATSIVHFAWTTQLVCDAGP